MTSEKIRVLIADDEDSLRLSISAWLQDEGFEVDDAADGDEAIQKLQSSAYQIALLDIKMPGQNGLEVLRFIKKNILETEVILMTGMSDISMAVEAMKLGASDYLTKPLDMNVLGTQIRSIIRKRDAEERIQNLQAEHTARLLYDLRNPINGLKQSIGYLMKGMAGPVGDHQRELLTYMTTTIDKVIHLLDDMMDLTKLEGGRVRLNKGISNPNDSIAKILQEYHIPIESKKISLTFESDPEITPIEYDQEKIEQVLENLLSNAVKYAPEGGAIELKAQAVALVLEEGLEPSDFIMVSVMNTGEGIPPEEIPRIFDRFRIVDEKKDEQRSTGLGLMICQRIIEAHNGKIWVESEPGKITTFYFALPVR
ncbi:MAG: response regulator [Ignavibacteria bacterium]|nr:response regulator [Ignavibacteria bacterium]